MQKKIKARTLDVDGWKYKKNRVYVFGIGNKFFQQFGEVLSGILAGLMAESIVVEIPHNGLLA